MIDSLGDFANSFDQFCKENAVFDSMFGSTASDIEFPIQVEEIEFSESRQTRGAIAVGTLVSVRPVDGDGKDETHLGIYLGEFPVGASLVYNIPTKKLTASGGRSNPAILIPSLKRVVRGYESWWGTIKSTDEFKKISDEDIQNVWYVKAIRELNGMNDTKEEQQNE